MLTEQLRVDLEDIFQERGYVVTGSSGKPSKTYWKKGGGTGDILAKLDKVQKQYALANIKDIEKKRISAATKLKKSAVSPGEKTALGKALKRITPQADKPERRGQVLPLRARKAA